MRDIVFMIELDETNFKLMANSCFHAETNKLYLLYSYVAISQISKVKLNLLFKPRYE